MNVNVVVVACVCLWAVRVASFLSGPAVAGARVNVVDVSGRGQQWFGLWGVGRDSGALSEGLQRRLRVVR